MQSADDRELGAWLTPRRVACGAAVVAGLLLARRVRKLEAAARGTGRRLATVEAAVATAAASAAAGCDRAGAEIDQLVSVCDAVRSMIRRAEEAGRFYNSNDPPASRPIT